jgi:hypothetical protein
VWSNGTYFQAGGFVSFLWIDRPAEWKNCVDEEQLRTISERHRRRLGDTVIDHSRASGVRRHRRGADNVTLLRLDHTRQELADGVPVADAVDLEDLVEVGIGDFSDEVGATDAGVVAEDGGGAVLGLDLVGDLFDAGRGGDVALVEEDFAGC